MKNLPLLIVLSAALTALPCFADTLSDGIAAFKNGDFKAAIKHLQARIKQAPSDSVAHYYLASSYNRAKENALAIAEYKYCVMLNNDRNVFTNATITLKNLK